MAEDLGYSVSVHEGRRAPADDDTQGDGDAALLKLAHERFRLAQAADQAQRERELADLRFYAGDQWPPEVISARKGQDESNGLPAVPPRPTLTINKAREPVKLVLNQERQADMAVELVPADDFGEGAQPISDAEITLREGLARRIQRSSEAADARTWAFARAVIAGRGYYGITTRFCAGKTWDRDIAVRRFFQQASVTLDPTHEEPDGSDAEWGFIGTDMPWDQYRAEFPTVDSHVNPVVVADQDDFRALGDEAPEWFRSEGSQRSCRVVEYFYTVRTARTLAKLADGTSAWEDELPSGAEIVDRREAHRLDPLRDHHVERLLAVARRSDHPLHPALSVIGLEFLAQHLDDRDISSLPVGAVEHLHAVNLGPLDGLGDILAPIDNLGA